MWCARGLLLAAMCWAVMCLNWALPSHVAAAPRALALAGRWGRSGAATAAAGSVLLLPQVTKWPAMKRWSRAYLKKAFKAGQVGWLLLLLRPLRAELARPAARLHSAALPHSPNRRSSPAAAAPLSSA